MVKDGILTFCVFFVFFSPFSTACSNDCGGAARGQCEKNAGFLFFPRFFFFSSFFSTLDSLLVFSYIPPLSENFLFVR